MTTARTYSKSDAQKRTIEGLFSIMLHENPREAETLLIRLQRQMRDRQVKGANIG